MTMPILTWNGMISSSMHFTHLSRWPGRMWYCRSSKIMRASLESRLGRRGASPATTCGTHHLDLGPPTGGPAPKGYTTARRLGTVYDPVAVKRDAYCRDRPEAT